MVSFVKRLIFWLLGTPLFLLIGGFSLVIIVFAWGLFTVVFNLDVLAFLRKYLHI